MTPNRHWTQWVLMGDDTRKVPVVLESIAVRIDQAIMQAKQEAVAEVRERCAAMVDNMDDADLAYGRISAAIRALK